MLATGWTWDQLRSTPPHIVEKTRLYFATQSAVQKPAKGKKS